MTQAEQRESARKFINEWRGKGYEKGDTQRFWIALLSDVLGMDNVTSRIVFEKEVIISGQTKFIDAYIPETRVMIEQKSLGKDLNKPIAQSGGVMLTPYEQAKNYANNMAVDEAPRWIITCNFSDFQIYDMNKPGAEPEVVKLDNLQSEIYRLGFLISESQKRVNKEMEVSIQAGDLVGLVYDELLKQYKNPDSDESLKSLNALCVRLVFCLYAEDAGIFGRRGMFHDYLMRHEIRDLRKALIELFKTLDTKIEDRDPYLDDELAEFPYVNGGLFKDEDIEIPQMTEKIRDLILVKASEDFDWSQISPTIFGAVFESTLNPETRRSGGMHYTSIENIHKVIAPLFLDDLKEELEQIRELKTANLKKQKLEQFQNKLASLKFLDPACGSGNFLTESYISLRRLENEVLKMKIEVEKGQVSGQITFGEMGNNVNPIQVSIQQFYGIEINDFAVKVAMTSLWIAESQMMKETEDVIHMNLDFLPLKSYTNIVEGNALRMNWNEVISTYDLNYIMGNPPFVGSARLTNEQREDRDIIFGGHGGELDYVACWYKKAADYIQQCAIRCAFVSTNSICQGQQVEPLWEYLMQSGIVINFAYRTFVWDSEASIKAHVYCVIIGFSRMHLSKTRIFESNSSYLDANNINGYLMDAPNVFISKRRMPLCDVPIVIKGFQPTDNGYLVLDDEEKNELVSKDPTSIKWIRPFITAKEYIHGKSRWCLWLKGITPAELNRSPLIKERVIKCKLWREEQKQSGDAYKLKDIPTLMRPSSKFVQGSFIILPRHTGERRRYVPFGFAEEGAIPGDSISVAINASLYHLGIVSSNVHMAWMRAVCGRLKGDYRYTSDIVYNNFVWPFPTEDQKATIEKTAQAILDARALYPDCSLADLYDETLMPIELRKAHIANDRAVMQAYGFSIKDMSEADCVAALMELYQQKVAEID